MKIAVTQAYVKPGVRFPFSYLMQRWLTGELSQIGAAGSERTRSKYGEDFDLVIIVTAAVGAAVSVTKGPAVARKDKHLEYALYLPYDAIMVSSDSRRAAATFLLDGIRSVFQMAGLNVGPLDQKKAALIEHLCSDPTMLDEPWPEAFFPAR